MNLELLIIILSSKASNVINIDIVKPIPPKKPAPIIIFQFKSLGNLARPNLIVKKDIKTIPNGLPKIKPKMILRF